MSVPIRAARFRIRGALSAAAGVAALLLACDPLYSVGARQYLAPARPATDAARSAPRDRHGPPALDVPRTAECLEAALRASPSVGDVRRWAEPGHLAPHEAGLSFALRDSALVARLQYANLHVRAWRDERPAVEIVTSWIGTARTFPAEEQRATVRVTTALLQRLRAACLPAASDAIECVAEGLGGRKACVPAP